MPKANSDAYEMACYLRHMAGLHTLDSMYP
jgi:hypothetical protein